MKINKDLLREMRN